MSRLRKILFFSVLFLFSGAFFINLFTPNLKAEEIIPNETVNFKAEVVEVTLSKSIERENGSFFTQQNLLLRGLEGIYKDKEIVYEGISEIEVTNSNLYKEGDKVFVDAYIDENGQETFYVVEFVRTNYLYILIAIFIILVIIVGRLKGLKALIGLALSFVVIIKFIIPQILIGRDPFVISLIGGLVILILMIYITEGIKRESHLAILSVFFSLLFILILSLIFTNLSKLTGLAQEEAIFLIGNGNLALNFKGLLLAGFIIGAIGVLDDIIVGQIETVVRLQEANPNLPAKKIFSLAYKVGNTHLGAIINTLFLTYAGAALPLLLLFVLNQSGGLTMSRVLNTEIISTEIIRTLVGSIGVIMAMPIATFLGSFCKIKK